jgi:hypothetical protein
VKLTGRKKDITGGKESIRDEFERLGQGSRLLILLVCTSIYCPVVA